MSWLIVVIVLVVLVVVAFCIWYFGFRKTDTGEPAITDGSTPDNDGTVVAPSSDPVLNQPSQQPNQQPSQTQQPSQQQQPAQSQQPAQQQQPAQSQQPAQQSQSQIPQELYLVDANGNGIGGVGDRRYEATFVMRVASAQVKSYKGKSYTELSLVNTTDMISSVTNSPLSTEMFNILLSGTPVYQTSQLSSLYDLSQQNSAGATPRYVGFYLLNRPETAGSALRYYKTIGSSLVKITTEKLTMFNLAAVVGAENAVFSRGLKMNNDPNLPESYTMISNNLAAYIGRTLGTLDTNAEFGVIPLTDSAANTIINKYPDALFRPFENYPVSPVSPTPTPAEYKNFMKGLLAVYENSMSVGLNYLCPNSPNNVCKKIVSMQLPIQYSNQTFDGRNVWADEVYRNYPDNQGSQLFTFPYNASEYRTRSVGTILDNIYFANTAAAPCGLAAPHRYVITYDSQAVGQRESLMAVHAPAIAMLRWDMVAPKRQADAMKVFAYKQVGDARVTTGGGYVGPIKEGVGAGKYMVAEMAPAYFVQSGNWINTDKMKPASNSVFSSDMTVVEAEVENKIPGDNQPRSIDPQRRVHEQYVPLPGKPLLANGSIYWAFPLPVRGVVDKLAPAKQNCTDCFYKLSGSPQIGIGRLVLGNKSADGEPVGNGNPGIWGQFSQPGQRDNGHPFISWYNTPSVTTPASFSDGVATQGLVQGQSAYSSNPVVAITGGFGFNDTTSIFYGGNSNDQGGWPYIWPGYYNRGPDQEVYN